MSNSVPSRGASADPTHRSPAIAATFAALGEPTRLGLVTRLCDGSSRSIAQLTAGESLSRQAISKHLRVLENARVVQSRRSGRECLYTLNPQSIEDVRAYIELVSSQWDDALSRLRSLVEE